MTKFANCDENSINFFYEIQFFYCFCSLILVVFFLSYTFEMVLLTHGRISFGGFLCLPNPFGQSLLFLSPMIMQHSLNVGQMCKFYCDTVLLLPFVLMYTFFIFLKFILFLFFFL